MKFLRNFKTLSEAQLKGNEGLYSPHIDIVAEKDSCNIKQVRTEKFTCEFDNDGYIFNAQPIIPKYTVTLNSDGNGTCSGSGIYDWGTVITISASANTGYQFKQWSDGNTENPRQLTVTNNITLGCVFEEKPAGPSNDEIWYTTESNTAIDFDSVSAALDTYGFIYDGPQIVSNIYEDGLGIVKFVSAITKVGLWMEGEEYHYCLPLFDYVQMANLNIKNDVTSVYFPDSVTILGGTEGLGEFTYCSTLREVYLGQNTIEIGDFTFMGTFNLKSIAIPNTVTTIGNAFYYCPGLTGITIPSSVTSIGEMAFLGCYFANDNFINNSTCTSEDNWGVMFCDSETNEGILISGQTAVLCRSWATNVTIPNSVTNIGDAMCYETNCVNLTSVTIGNSVTSIGESAFEDCESLTGITIPNSVTNIGNNAFNDCYFVNGNFINNSTCTSSTNWGAELYDSEQSDGLLISGTTAARCRPWAINITIPNTITKTGYQAFYERNKLTSVTLPISLEFIGEESFSRSTITGITIPDSVTTIDEWAFKDCDFLTTVTIGSGVTKIWGYAFKGCNMLIEVICNPTTPPSISTQVFNNNAEGRKIKVPAGSVDAYKAATNWSDYADDIISQ